jgi:hypothetical protein
MSGRLVGCRSGDVLRGRTIKFTLARVLAFSGGAFGEPGWPQRNLHTDRAKAREAGLPDIIVSGTQFEGVLLTHLVDLFGYAWHSGGELNAKIVKSAFVNDEVTPVAVVRDTAAGQGGAGVELDVWCEKQDGEKILVGHARICMDAKG